MTSQEIHEEQAARNVQRFGSPYYPGGVPGEWPDFSGDSSVTARGESQGSPPKTDLQDLQDLVDVQPDVDVSRETSPEPETPEWDTPEPIAPISVEEGHTVGSTDYPDWEG